VRAALIGVFGQQGELERGPRFSSLYNMPTLSKI
jgi:hypothetical protein